MKIVCDKNITLASNLFSNLGDICFVDGRSLSREQLSDADILLVRSVTSVNKELLKGTSVRFVGSATSGFDHVDLDCLHENGIEFSSAPGCNAIAVAEYVISSLYALSQENAQPLSGKTIGIVGVGNIGSCLADKLKALNVNVLLCDPLKHEQGLLKEHIGLDELLAKSDVVTLHVPLIKTGNHKTLHLIDQTRLKALKPGLILINACRGEVIDNRALLKVMEQGADLDLVLDVWENEPDILTPLLDHVRYASVHIAGHTLEGKARGTQMLYQALCELKNVKGVKIK